MKIGKIYLILLCPLFLYSQKKVDGQFDFQSEKGKKYSLYIPSKFQKGDNAVLALHPLNTSRWNSKSWRDTLIQFAEDNHSLLICPDGGVDGRIDDDIDTAFTSTLIDSVQTWYGFNKSNLVALGFSWGGRTVYSYGLLHRELFKGLIPIGAAIEGLDLNPLTVNAKGLNIYIIHGSADAIATRYTPAIESLNNKEACLMDTIMNGVGHTIDFPKRNKIISDAYQFIIQNNCVTTSTENIVISQVELFIDNNNSIHFTSDNLAEFQITNFSGQNIGTIILLPGKNNHSLSSGQYILYSEVLQKTFKILIH